MDTSAPAAPVTADAKEGASSAPTTPGPRTAAQMDARMSAIAADIRAKSAPPTSPAPPAAAAAVDPAGVADGEHPDGTKPEEKKAEKLIPHATFQKRLGEVAAKRDAAIAESQRVSLENSKLKAALEFALAEADRFRGDHQQGKQYDQRDVQVYELEMEKKAAETFSRLQQEHEAKLAKYADEQREALVIDRERSKLESELDRALSRYKHIDRESLLQAAEKRPAVNLVEIAKALDDQFARRAEAAGYARHPAPSPLTVRAPGGSAPTGRRPYTAAAMDAYIKDFIASRGE